MRTRPERSPVLLAGLFVVALVSCSGDIPTGGQEEALSQDRAPSCRYLTQLLVDPKFPQQHEGAHFRRIGDALAAVREGRLARGERHSAACRITITVAAGLIRGTDNFDNTDPSLEHFPFVLDVPDITLRGALEMGLDASGRATGTSVTHQETTLAPIAPLSDSKGGGLFLIVADPNVSSGNGFTLEGFVLQSGPTGTGPLGVGVLGVQPRNLTLRGNRFESLFQTIDLQGSSAVVELNHISGGGQCDLCIAGPGVYRVTGNKILAGGTHGIFTGPAINSAPDGPAASEIFADIINNEVRDHRQQPISAGIRIGAVGLGAPNVSGSSHIRVRDNLLVNNNFGLMLDALFPQPGTKLKGDIDVTTSGNVVLQSCQANLLVAFTRHNTALGFGSDPYLLNSTYRLTLGGDLPFSEAWFSNPPGFGNTLLVNGRQIAHRTRQFFDPNSCPGTTGSSIVLNGASAQ